MPKKLTKKVRQIDELEDHVVRWMNRAIDAEQKLSLSRAQVHRLSAADAISRRDTLIRWLALPWADNDPLFPLTHIDAMTGVQFVAVNDPLRDTWIEVVRDKSAVAEREGGGNSAAPLTEG